jgi:hypothetical protein
MLKKLLVLSFLLILSTISFANYIDAGVYSVVRPDSPLVITGYERMANGSAVPNVNITTNASIPYNGSLNTSVSNNTGYFCMYLMSPNSTGEYNLTIKTNTSLSKTIHFYVSNITTGYINFTGTKPPYSAGRSFTILLYMSNSTGGPLANYKPTVEIYPTNGPAAYGWNITNMTTAGTSGYITYNITIPSDADGQYAIIIDRGVINTIVLVKSIYIMAVNTQTDQNETKTDFHPGGNFTIIAKIRDTSGNPIGYATSVTARITKPDGSVDSTTLTNDTTREGYYNSSAYMTNSSLTGRYTIDVSAMVAGKKIESTAIINTASTKARIEKQQDFFKEWGDDAAFAAGGTVGFNIIVVNISSDGIFTGGDGSAGTVNCTNTSTLITGIYNSNGSSVSVGTISYGAQGMYMGQPVCSVKFTAPTFTDTYKVTFTTTVSGQTVNGTGYFDVQKYILKPVPVMSMGGSFDFMTMVYPGDNTTFQVSAYDINGQAEIAGINITNLTVTRIIPLEFNAGDSDILEGPQGRSDAFNITNYTAGSDSLNPTITIMLPANQTGPFQAEIRAIIRSETANETVTGKAFYVAKYIMGFLSSMGGMKNEMDGDMMGGSFGGGSSCSGNENFYGNAMDIKTNSAPSDPVAFNNIIEAREEMTGKSVTQCISMTTNSTDTNGYVNVPVFFNNSIAGCSDLSGGYFMMVNVTYRGRTDIIPSGFMCKRLMFWPQIKDNMGNYAWKVSSDGVINLSIDRPRRINDSVIIRGGTVQIIRANNFNQFSGGKMFFPSGFLGGQLHNGTFSILITPSNFSLSEWPNGFMELAVVVTGNSTYGGVTDTNYGGFQVTPFDAYVMKLNGNYNAWGQTLSGGQNIVVTVAASTNVSRVNNLASSVIGEQTWSGFEVSIGVPWEGRMRKVQIINATLVSDDWNSSQDSNFWGREIWDINFTIPDSVKKGYNEVMVNINNSRNEKTEASLQFITAQYSVMVGMEEGLMMETFTMPWMSPADDSMLLGLGFNVTNITLTYGINTSTGGVCVRIGLNMTRWDESGGQQTPNHFYGDNIRILSFDNPNETARLFLTNGTNIWELYPSQNFTTELYLWKIDGCGYSKWINASATPSGGSWGGSWEKGTIFTMPYIVKKAGAAASGVTVGFNAIIKQMDSTGQSQGGFGFERKLAANEYTANTATTDANGIGFVQLNVSGTSGSMMIFWKINMSGIEDVASFNSMGGGDGGTQVQIRNFDTWGQRVARLGSGHATAIVRLTKLNSTAEADPPETIWGWSFGLVGDSVYNGTFNEALRGDFIEDGINKTYYVLYNFTNKTYTNGLGSEALIIGNSTNLSTEWPQNHTNYYLVEDSTSFGISEARVMDENRTALVLFREGGNNWYSLTSASKNLTVRVCAQTFAKPGKPYAGASVYLYGETWMGSTPTPLPLQWYDPVNGTLYTFGERNSTTGPSGCAALDVMYPAGWPANLPVNVKATITYGGNSESTWVDNVFRQSQCSNGVDDDNDGGTDFMYWGGTADAHCSSWMDDNESA